MPKEKILVVDDESLIRWTLCEALRNWNYEPIEASSVVGALSGFESERPAAVLLDINLPDGSGLDVLNEIKRQQPHAVVIMITANVLVEDTLAALRGGAYDFIGKPINLSELQVTIRNGIEANKLRKEVQQIRREKTREFNFEQIIGSSHTMQRLIALAHKVAESEASSVLLQGESGTGKDLVAKAIHYSSRRADAPFVAINCAAIPGTLIESELFGFEKGSFTDAKARKEGLFEQAEGGTIFLDEIGELELGLQAKLLRVLEEGAFRRVGGLKDLPLDVRILAASNRDLKSESDAGRFRLDLYYRLSVIQIDLPPLRERGDDVLQLAEFYLAQFNRQFNKSKRPPVRGLTPEVAEIFRRYEWPGNVRELRNVIERAMILEDGDLITTNYLPRGLMKTDHQVAPPIALAAAAAAEPIAAPLVAAAPSPAVTIQPEATATVCAEMFRLPMQGLELETVELSFVRQALERSNGNQTRAAELLGISRDQLRYRLKKLEDIAHTED
ncbi:MAG: sigma-54-dependent Fis family transcriptional regulator [Acidobacteria bacterium]|nr:sigma-54-dependent Fis family transcriptional regulator [Acidobacteriota bacterium]